VKIHTFSTSAHSSSNVYPRYLLCSCDEFDTVERVEVCFEMVGESGLIVVREGRYSYGLRCFSCNCGALIGRTGVTPKDAKTTNKENSQHSSSRDCWVEGSPAASTRIVMADGGELHIRYPGSLGGD
jgi:hypothetical protein